MTTVTVILDEQGVYENAFSCSEVDLKVLRRGVDDSEIDEVEITQEEIE